MGDVITVDTVKPPVTKPLIHSNGSGRQNLLENYLESARKVNDAINSLQQNGPNMRDYYPMENGTRLFHQACAEHALRIERLNDVLAELHELMEHVDK